MTDWNQPEYQRIRSATRRGGQIVVLFEDGSGASVEAKKLIPPNVEGVDWKCMTFSPFEITVPAAHDRELEIPWSTIRVLTDRDFSRYFAATAEEDARRIGLRIRALRESRGISSKELAERAGIAPQSLSRIENGRHDVVLTTLQRILAAMGCSLRDLVPNNHSKPSIQVLLNRLDSVGVDRDFVFKRLVRETKPEPWNEHAAESLVSTVAKAVSRVYGWSIDSLLGEKALTLDAASLGIARFKKFSRTKEIQATAYALYVHWVALLAIQASPPIGLKGMQIAPRALRKDLEDHYGELTFQTLLSYAWEHGIVVLPLSDAGMFHGACWKIQDRIAIVLKQKTLYQARWLFDLAHELGHALIHLSEAYPTILELETISPFADDQEEQQASDFAQELLFRGPAEDLAKVSVDRARGNMRMLKRAVVEVAVERGVPTDWLANYLAFRLSMQGQNWWGAANNLQVSDPSPLAIAREELRQRIDMDRLNPDDRQILIQAVTD
jgi:transcriptional regulator with XRE-family HTH domain/Zn-dependent peptidase ImmA (M78 family)